jgi:putative ABC transport system substrate-binding protein
MSRLKFFALLALVVMCSDLHAKDTVAITQITSHPSLDQIRKGLIDGLLKERPDLNIIFDNANGNITTAAQIAQKFLSLKPSAIVAITTPSAQTIAKATEDSKIPLVFAAVTDPIGASLLTDLKVAAKGITGTVDQPPIEDALIMMQEFDPDLHTIAVIYNSGEANSQFQLAALKEAALKHHINVKEISISKASEIQMAVQSIIKQVDAIFLPNDNLVVSSLEPILKVAQDSGVPVYASDPDSVERGALAALAFDQYEIGQQTAPLVLDILNGKAVTDVPPHLVTNPKFYINKDVARAQEIPSETIDKLTKQYNETGKTHGNR